MTYFKCKCNDDFRLGYELIKLVEERFNEPDGKTLARKERIDNLKRELRKWSHRKPEERRIVKDYGIDGFVELRPLDYDFDSTEEAEEYFREYLFLRCRPSMYDCTGQWFTEWFKVFKRHDRWWVYHSIGIDV